MTEHTYRAQVSLIFKYFPDLDEKQQAQFAKLYELYAEWNEQINVISRKDMDNFYLRHVLHSLAIAQHLKTPSAKTQILDVGTGGGFPGIPLAILFPQVSFHLVDSIGKKIKVVEEIVAALDLQNVTAEKIRAEQVNGQFDYIVSRAVTRFAGFMPWIKGKFKKQDFNEVPNGLFYLKGGDLKEEIKEAKIKAVEYDITEQFEEDFFDTKKVVYVKPPKEVSRR